MSHDETLSRASQRIRTPSKERDALLRQTAALAGFGELALRTDDLDAILQEGCQLVGEALGTELAKTITIEERILFVRAGTGWPPGIVGELRMKIEDDSADQFALASGEPIVVVDTKKEKRFKIADFVLAEGIVSFVNVPIVGAVGRPPFGILEVDSRQLRRFTADDISFLRTYANMIAAAVDRQRTIEELRDVAEQRMQLLNELQHRVKNNLQSVSAIIEITIRDSSNPATKEILRSLSRRVEALVLVHSKIYASGKFDRIELASYLGEVVTTLLRFHQSDRAKIGFVSNLNPLMVSPDTATPLGLIVSEFVTNSMKYAFEGNGTISLHLDRPTPGSARLIMSDNGKGLTRSSTGGTGMKLISALSRQLKAKVQWRGDDGTELTLVFPAGLD